ELLDGIPGVNGVTAATVIAEIGIQMSQWPTVGHLTSWAGLCPGQNESAGKRGKSKIRPGNPYLRSALVEAASAATGAKDSYFREKYDRLKARRGHKRAVVAVAHKILIAIYHVLSSETPDQELGADDLERLEPERLKRNLVRRLERLGYRVNLEPNRAYSATRDLQCRGSGQPALRTGSTGLFGGKGGVCPSRRSIRSHVFHSRGCQEKILPLIRQPGIFFPDRGAPRHW